MTAPGSAELPARREQLPGSKVLAWIMMVAPDRLSPADSALLARIVQGPDAAALHWLVQCFVAFVREAGRKGNGSSAHGNRRLAAFEAWIVEARASGIRAAKTFAGLLAVDAAAVRAALTMPWSNAQFEGQITKLKLIKRLMYGRPRRCRVQPEPHGVRAGRCRARLIEGYDQVGLRLDLMRALIDAHRLGQDVVLTGEVLKPPTGARQADPKAFGSSVSGGAGRDGMDHALTQIDGQG